MKVIYDNNLNATIIVNEDEIEDLNNENICICAFIDMMCDNDFDPFGDSFCLNNYEMGHAFYNLWNDKLYIFNWNCLEEMKAGKSITLCAREMDKWSREIYELENDF